MFRVTFLGHQGWLISAGDTHLLVDPLLTRHIGHHRGVRELVYPPRRIETSSLPPIAAVMITHEHPDHFSIPSLHSLSRKVPLYLSALSSCAARTILEEMGFRVRPLVAGRPVRVGQLDFHPMATSHLQDAGDEWDTLPFLVRDRSGGGSFFSHVDVPATAELFLAAHAIEPRIDLVGLTFNSQYARWPVMGDTPAPELPSRGEAISRLEGYLRMLATCFPAPEAFVGSGEGFAYEGELAWLNENVFAPEPFDIYQDVGRRATSPAVLAPLPGHSLILERGRLREVQTESSFVRRDPPDAWPKREYMGSVPRLAHYSPICGTCELEGREIAEIKERLSPFAAYLFGRDLFRLIRAIPPGARGKRKATLALVLRDGERAHTLEYDPRACAFRIVQSADPLAEYVAGLECWATDLLAILHGELPVYYLFLGRYRYWLAPLAGVTLSLNLLIDLVNYFHPLRHPEAHLRYYRSTLRHTMEEKDAG